LELAKIAGLTKAAGATKEITLVGVRDCIEVWDAERWSAFCETHLDSYDQIAEAALCSVEERSAEVQPVGVLSAVAAVTDATTSETTSETTAATTELIRTPSTTALSNSAALEHDTSVRPIALHDSLSATRHR